MKKPKLLLAVLALMIGAASAAGPNLPNLLQVPTQSYGERAMLQFHKKGGS